MKSTTYPHISNFSTVFSISNHCLYLNTTSKGELHALKDQVTTSEEIILLRFTCNFLFCLNVPAILRFLTIRSLLISLAQAGEIDPDFCPTNLILSYCPSVVNSCPVFHALNSICFLLSPLHNRNTVRIKHIWFNCFDACPRKVLVTLRLLLLL